MLKKQGRQVIIMETVNSIYDMLEKNGQRYSGRKAFSYHVDGEIVHMSFRRLFREVKYLASALLYENGEKCAVGIYMPNGYKWCVSYLAVTTIAGIACPIDTDYSVNQIKNVIDFVGIKCVITDEKGVEKLIQTGQDIRIICLSDEKYAEMKETGKNNPFSEDMLNGPDDTAVLMFTSGTTDVPKAVMLSNRNLLSDIKGVTKRFGLSMDDRTLCTLPLYHSYQCIVFLSMLFVGGNVSFSRGYRLYNEDMTLFRPTIVTTVPLVLEKTHRKIFKKLSEQNFIKRSFTVGKIGSLLSRRDGEKIKKIIYSQIHKSFGGELKYFICGGAAMNSEIAKDFYSFGFPVIIGYGLTECSPIVSCNAPDDLTFDSVGKTIEGAEIRIVSPGENETGEILVKGPMVMKGYYNDKDLTDKVIEDGWFHTGDMGYVDENENLHITGRIKNIIIGKNGKNIYPEELENELRTNPVVLEALIYSDDDEQDVVADIVPDENMIKLTLEKENLSQEDIENAIDEVIEKTNRHLPRYKRIKKVKVSEAGLEKSSVQKIKRKRAGKNDKSLS